MGLPVGEGCVRDVCGEDTDADDDQHVYICTDDILLLRFTRFAGAMKANVRGVLAMPCLVSTSTKHRQPLMLLVQLLRHEHVPSATRVCAVAAAYLRFELAVDSVPTAEVRIRGAGV